MVDIKGAFRVHTRSFVNTHFTVVLLKDRLLFVKTGNELTDSAYASIAQEDLNQYRSMSVEQIIGLSKQNYQVGNDEIISLKLKKSSIGLNGPRTGTITLVTRNTRVLDIARFQNFDAIDAMLNSAFPGKATYDSFRRASPVPAASRTTADQMAEKRISATTADTAGDAGLSRNERSVRNGSMWMFIIAAISLVNFLVYAFGGTYNFVVGLGITQLLSGVAKAGLSRSSGVVVVAAVLTVVLAGTLAVLGVLTRRGKTWAIVAGIAIYAIDGIIFLLMGDWLSIAFHAFVLYLLILSAIAAFRLRRSRILLTPERYQS